MTSDNFETHKITCPECGTVNSVISNTIGTATPIDCSKCHASLGRWGEAQLKFATPRLRPAGA